ncbi:hypothetical protein [Nannocystis bainbridge]|uniref:P/Homo B domain-containing protein n=1 Tax=Nannocystis bainbridge TaxID=2995303 RepID=A0ABT5E8N9_9BACT|nr:hypothetical protein [Nannocystis bainbridge]MDC0721111.1 hypothetical protein [Nannocystis bainbridge]
MSNFAALSRFVPLTLLVATACAGEPGGTGATTSAGETGTSSETSGEPAESTSTSTGEVTTGEVTTGEVTTGEPTTGPEITSTTSTDTTSTDTTSTDTTNTDTTSTTSTTGTTGDPDVPLQCPEAIDQAILACVAALQSDPELAPGNFLLDLLFMCSDAEPVADDYDAHCASAPDDPICDLEYPQFVETVLPACISRAQTILFTDVCLLPDSYDGLLFAPGIVLMDRRIVTSAAELDATEQEQLLRASAEIGVDSGSVEAALSATDEGEVELLTVLDVGTDRVLVLFSARYDGARHGRLFFWHTLTIAGAIEADVFTRCGVEQTIEGQPCEDALTCGDSHTCFDVLEGEGGVVLAPGTCVSQAAIPGDGEACSAHADCVPANGLLCLDRLEGEGDGVCRPGWMRRSFAGPAGDSQLVAAGTLLLPILASGVATVPTAAYLDLQIVQDAANSLAVHLVNPTGTSSAVITADGPVIDLQLFKVGVPGDESAGGTWFLAVEDLGGAASGAVTRLTLTVDTRYD